MKKNNKNKVNINVSVTPKIYMRGYYTTGVHESPVWYCFLQFNFWSNFRNVCKTENSGFDIVVPNEPYLLELTLSYGEDFEKVRNEGTKKAKKLLGNASFSFKVSDLTLKEMIKKEIGK